MHACSYALERFLRHRKAAGLNTPFVYRLGRAIGPGRFNEQLKKLVAIEPRLLRSNRSMAATVSTSRLQEANLLRHACFACIVGKRSVQERRREASEEADGPAFAIEGFLSSSNKAGVLANVDKAGVPILR